MFLKQTGKTQPSTDTRLQPWVEKYRPQSIDEVSAQEHTVAVLKKALTSTNLPHMLFYGPPGTGKTSTILALARELFGPQNFRSRILELNASDERGISIVREKIKTFARQTPRRTPEDSAYPCPPYKIVILDEADSMTQDAQGALRRIMETHSRITRFCLVCNYITRIIEPLASRCSKFRFTPLSSSATLSRLEHIAASESIAVSPQAFKALITTSDGDLRRSITYLQSAARLSLSVSSTGARPITPADIQEIAGTVPDPVVLRFLAALGVDPPPGSDDAMDVDGDESAFIKPPRVTGFNGVRDVVKEIMRAGYSTAQLIIQIHDVMIHHPILTSRQKAQCALIFAEADKALNDGGDEELQLLEVGMRVHKALL
ncbi:hypothetical protein BS47DRAFT_1336669 [Hydnum rufescens UP504]|uniref:Replication factor C subunit 2 n=1 Tax=Hydnum rufescens UP504 TaxID=1448309 RepID=A0A9P6B9B7_9AGAM|nr:hypothetical protein BS47DRAFT_1336669 [Hydnum rufescens UP504]